MSNEINRYIRRMKRLSPLVQVGIKQESLEKVSRNVIPTEPWTQNETSVTNGDVTLAVGSRIIGYVAKGISDWYVLGAEDGKLLITTRSCPEKVRLHGRDGYTNGVEILNNAVKDVSAQ